MGYTTFTYGSLTLNAENVSVERRQKTIKQTVGKQLAILGPAIGISAKERLITLSGKLTGGSKDADRTTLEGLDDAQRHAYSDGMHSGDFAVVSLSFPNDGGGQESRYLFRLTLVEW